MRELQGSQAFAALWKLLPSPMKVSSEGVEAMEAGRWFQCVTVPGKKE